MTLLDAASASSAAPQASLLLPEGTRLLHIGPAKTGTTSLQSAFHANRVLLAEHGVHYAGSDRQPRAAAGGVATGRRIAGHRRGPEAWPELVAEVRASTARRVVISSETFARADDAGAAAVIDAFGARRTHVVITMRPLVDMLSSSWQQYVQVGSRKTWEAWLDEMLRSADTLGGPQPEFWRKTRVDALARRWSALVGPERVTVVSLADRPRDFVLRTFERLTGLPDGALMPVSTAENGSLGFGVAELLRRFNELLAEQDGTTADLQALLVEFGAVRHLRRTPDALGADARIEVPQWAADRSTAVVEEMTAGLRATGVRIVGDLEALARPARPPVPSVSPPESVSTEAAAHLLVGMMLAAGRGVPDFQRLTSRPPVPVEQLDAATLAGHLARRIGRAARARLTRR